MSATNAFETSLGLLLFNNTNIAAIGDAIGLRGSTVAGLFYISLHTADPGEAPAGGQTTNETAYTNYVRVAVARSAAGFTVSGNNVSNAAAVAFASGGATGSLVTHFGIGTDPSGVGNLLLKGALIDSLQVNNGIVPTYAIGVLDVNLD